MNKSPKKICLGFKILFGLTIAFLLLYFVMFLVFGLSATKVNDADIKGGLGDVFKYHFSDMKGLFSFNFHQASNIVYFSLSGLLYFFIFIALLYVAVGILLIVKRKRLILIPGMVASALVIFVFMMVATGTPKYWYIINQRGAFENDKSLMGPTVMLLIFSVLYGLSAYILYFYSAFIAIKEPGVQNSEEQEEVALMEEEEKVTEKPQVEKAPVQETVKQEEPVVEQKPANDDEPVMFEEVNVEEEQQPKENKEDLKTVLAELVRDIVRDEIARNNAYQGKQNNPNNNGFNGGPLIVQYFNTMPMETPKAAQPVTQEQVKQEAKEEPKPEAKKEAVKPAPSPVVKAPQEKNPIIRIPFTERMLSADKEMQDNYNELKNEILSYGVNYRVSNSGDTFRLHRKTYIKITIAGLSLKLYFALNPDDYKDSTIPVQNAGHKGIYEEIPLVFKVKSGLSMRRCKQLIQDVFEKNGFEQGEVGNINWVEDLKNSPNNDED